jgi:hypothetical protein
LASLGLCFGFDQLANVYGYKGTAYSFYVTPNPIYFEGGVRLCGFTGTVLGPGFGASGFFLGVGDGIDLLCGFTGTVFLP